MSGFVTDYDTVFGPESLVTIGKVAGLNPAEITRKPFPLCMGFFLSENTAQRIHLGGHYI